MAGCTFPLISSPRAADIPVSKLAARGAVLACALLLQKLGTQVPIFLRFGLRNYFLSSHPGANFVLNIAEFYTPDPD